MGRSNVKRYIGDEIAAVRAIIEVEAPYFIEGQSALQVRITEPMSWFNWTNTLKRLKEVEIYDYSKRGMETTINVSAKNYIMSTETENLIQGDYIKRENKSFVVVRDIGIQTFTESGFALSEIANIELSAWARLSLHGDANHASKNTIWFPWRTEHSFAADPTKDVDKINEVAEDGNTWSSSSAALT